MLIFPKKLSHRSSLLALASSLAIAPVPALAQSFDGFGEVFAGSAMISETPGNTTVIVNTDSVIIDWAPNDGAINAGVPIQFQAPGTTATFVDGNGTDYAVLNRIVATDLSRPIVFDGNVVSQVQGSIGGTVFFYSPSGIIVGSNAAFDVGRLGLTTSEIADQGFGDWLVSDMVDFAGALVPDSQITIEAGATISALQESSYVALFAPSIQQDGLIEVNGQAAFVAASAGIMRFSPDGLFDIEVFVGSEATGGVGISHGGVTTGPQSSGPFDAHRIYMVSVARNTALKIALGDNSQIGFDVAGAANVDGNAVVLSAGSNLIMGQTGGLPGDIGTNTIEITSAIGTSNQFTSSVTASSTDSLLVSGAGIFDFASDTLFEANDLTISGVVSVTGIFDIFAFNDLSAIGAINADTAILSSGGNLTLDMVDTVSDAVLTATGLLDVAAVQSVGGNILLDGMAGVNAGLLDAAGNLDVSSAADAILNGPAVAGADANITAQNITAQDISAIGNLTIMGQNIATGALGAGGVLDVNAANDLSAIGAINADSAILFSGGNLALDMVDTVGDALLTTTGLLDVAAVQSTNGNILLDGMAGVNAGLLDAAGNLDVMSPGAVIITGPANAGGAINITAGTTLDLADMVNAGIDLMLAGNGITATALSAGNNLDISSAADATLNGPVIAGANANITAQNVTAQDISAIGNLTIMGQDIATGALGAGGILDVNAANGLSAIGAINADSVILFSGGDLTLDTVDTVGDALLTATGLLDVAAVQSAGGNILLDGMAGVNAGLLDAAGNLDVMSPSAVIITGPANAGGAINITAGTTLDLVEMVNAATDLMLAGDGITAAALSAGNNLDINAVAGAVLNGVTMAGANATITGDTITTQDINAIGNLTIMGQDIAAGALTAGGILDVNAANGLSSVGAINANSVILFSGGNLTLDMVDTVGDAVLTTTGLLDVAAVQSASGNILLDGMAGVNAGLLDGAGNIDVMSPGAVMITGPANAGGAVALSAGTTLDLVDMVNAGTDLMLAGDSITANALSSANDLTITSASDVTLNGPTNAGASANIAGDNIIMQTIAGGTDLTITGSDLMGIALTAGSVLDVNITGNIALTGAINADSATLMSGGDLDLVTVDTVNDASLNAGGQVDVDAVRATAGSIALDGMLGVNAGQLDAGGNLNVTSTQAITIADPANAGGALDFAAGTTLDLVGAATAGTDLMLAGNGITANAVNAGNNLTILSTADIALNGDADAGASATITGGNIAAQNITTNGDLTAMAQGDLAIVGGANSQSALSLTAVQSLDVGNASAVAAAALNAGGNLRAGTVDAGTIAAESQSSVTLAGTWTATDIVITAPQALFEAMGSLSAGANGNVSLFSTNAEGTFLGSFAAPPNMGFVLDADGLSRISAGNLTISATDLLGDGIDLAIGDLDLGSIAGLQNLTLGVAAGGEGGRVQLAGNLVATDNNAPIDVTISANLFELDTNTGSVALLSGANSAGGSLNIAADNIHIASTDLLDQLRADPFFDGFADALAAPAANSQPDGVLSADGLALTVGSTLYIQNTGADELPAGFVATLEGLNVIPDGQGDRPTVVINGAINTPDGQLVGEDATTALITKLGGTDQFSEDSQFNSCLLNSCQGATPVQDEEISAIVTSVVRAVNEDATIDGGTGTAADGTIDVATAIDTSGDADADINGAGDTSADDDFDLGDSDDGESSGDEESSEKDSEEEADEKDEQEESEGAATGPIAPPVSIISTGSLNQTGEINEAIASSGNSSLTDPEAGMANPDGDNE